MQYSILVFFPVEYICVSLAQPKFLTRPEQLQE